ncbi:MAG: gamma carbonic anhydrase family protein [Heliobacteriaceae bacterium]|nr:gamma carbonic anhydrase family protein [Heliobacteriaceae bacterium]
MPVYPIGEWVPEIDPDAYLAPTAVVAGQVTIAGGASLWFNTVVRGDLGWPVTIGANSNIQDNVVVHTDSLHPTSIGAWVTVGHGAIIHSARIGDYCLIGIGAVILDNTVIGEHSVVAANTVVPAGKEFPPYSLIIGTPAKLVKTFTPEEAGRFTGNAQRYAALWRHHYQGKV